MDNKQKVPNIPGLKGEENLEEWKSQLMNSLRFHGMVDYITIDYPHIKCARVAVAQSFVLGFIWASVSPVADQLVDVGWNPQDRYQDPASLYALIVNIFSPVDLTQVRRVGEAFRQMATSKTGMKLGQYKNLVHSARLHLKTLKAPITDKVAISVVLNALEAEYPVWHRSLVREDNAGLLTWTKLMSKIGTKATQDEAAAVQAVVVVKKSPTS